ncbi:MAG: hypothetical protein L0G87_01315 [Renibacterium salmoninarum]|nr:hypothetical protein [Renibacterium salmoninarum]
MAEFIIEYVIYCGDPEPENEIGFGSSGTWDCVNDALNAISADIENRAWETSNGMPDPQPHDLGCE